MILVPQGHFADHLVVRAPADCVPDQTVDGDRHRALGGHARKDERDLIEVMAADISQRIDVGGPGELHHGEIARLRVLHEVVQRPAMLAALHERA